MDGKLQEDGTDDVDVEDVGLGTLFGETFDGLRMLVDDKKESGSVTCLLTLARVMDRKQTDIIIPLIVTCLSPNLMPER